MSDASPDITEGSEAATRGSRHGATAVLFGTLWTIVGAVGVGLLWLTVVALTEGTASGATFVAALFGVILSILAGDELVQRVFGGTPL